MHHKCLSLLLAISGQLVYSDIDISGRYNSVTEWGEIISPSYYPDADRLYRWHLYNQEQNGGIRLVFDEFDLEQSDQIKIYTPDNAGHLQLQRTYDGFSKVRPSYENLHTNMTIEFNSGTGYESSKQRRFQLTYRFIRLSPGSRWLNRPDTSLDRSYSGTSALHSRAFSVPSKSGTRYVDTIVVLGVPMGYEGVFLRILPDTNLRGAVNGWGNKFFMEIRQGNRTTDPLINSLSFSHPDKLTPSTQLYPIYQSPVFIRIRGGFSRDSKLSFLFTSFSATECGLYTDQFRCKSGICIASQLEANGFENCPDGSDESVKPTPSVYPTDGASAICSGLEFACSQECIPMIKRCDDRVDCFDHKDELQCGTFCSGFTCRDGLQCISARSLCDGQNNCKDGSDEISCPITTPKPTKRTTSDGLDSSTTVLFIGALGIIACLLFAIILIMVRKRIIRCDKICHRRRNSGHSTGHREGMSTHLNLTVNNIASVHGLPPTYEESTHHSRWTGQVNMGYATDCIDPPPYSEILDASYQSRPRDIPPEYRTLDTRQDSANYVQATSLSSGTLVISNAVTAIPRPPDSSVSDPLRDNVVPVRSNEQLSITDGASGREDIFTISGASHVNNSYVSDSRVSLPLVNASNVDDATHVNTLHVNLSTVQNCHSGDPGMAAFDLDRVEPDNPTGPPPTCERQDVECVGGDELPLRVHLSDHLGSTQLEEFQDDPGQVERQDSSTVELPRRREFYV